jgi:hypothetical protein
MTRRFPFEDEISEPLTPRLDDDRFALDDALVETLLNGTAYESVPIHYLPVAAVLAGVQQPSTEGELGDGRGTAMFRTHRVSTRPIRRSTVSRRLLGAKTLLAAGALTVASATGAAAATGTLPGAAQDTAATVLAKIGITVPGPDSHSEEHPETHHPSSVTNGATSTSTTASTSTTSADAKNETIVSLATDPAATGLDKGQAVSAVASDGHSQAGASGAPLSLPTGPAVSTPAGAPVSTPAGPPASTPAGAPVSTPAGPPVSTPAGVPVSTPAGPPASTPAGAPVSTPVGPPASEAGALHRP